MTADFALSLFFEGIRLHRRTPEGWELVGEVPLDSPDLARDLAALRKDGEATGAPWHGTRLLLPPQQVRTLTLEGAWSEAEVRLALDGVTPYAVGDLVVDSAVAEGHTYVAAVARETLEEAEAFASEHGFRPLAFAAVLPDFPREARFGPTRLAAILPKETSAPKEPVGADPAEEPSSESIAQTAPAPAEARPVDAEPIATPDEAPALVEDGRAEPETAQAATEPASPVAAGLLATVPEPILASRVPPLQGERRAADTQEAYGHPEGPRIGPLPETSANPGQAPSAPAAHSTPHRSAPASPEAGATASIFSATPIGRASRPSATEVRRTSADSRRDGARVGGKPRYLGLILTVALLLVMATVAVLAATSEQGLAGLLRRSAPAATEVAAALPAEPAPAASELARTAPSPTPGELPDIPASAAPAPEAAARAVAAAMAALPRASETPDAPGSTRAAEFDQAEKPAASPEEADLVYAATGVWLRAPRLPLLPAPSEAGAGPALSALSAAKALEPPPFLAALTPDTGPDARFASALPDAPAAGNDAAPAHVIPDDAVAPSDVPVIAGAPFLASPARLGDPASSEPTSWVNAMAEPPSRLPPERPVSLEGFAAEASVAAVDGLSDPDTIAETPAPWANAMAEPPSRFPPERPEPPVGFEAGPASPSAGSAALAFADGAVPPAGGVSLAGLRPAARPGDLSPPEGYEPPPRVLASFDGPRPGPRPGGLAPEAPDVSDALAEALAVPEASASPDLQSTLAAIVRDAPDPLAGATRQAVAVARIPDSRPRAFDRVVQRQLDRVARASQAGSPRSGGGAGGVGTRGLTAQEEAEAAGQPQVASGVAAVPSGPTATSVAAAATHADVIALRDINLIGVYGQPGARRALVRLGNGRYLRVGVGDQLDGGQVTGIGDYALNYTKRGRTHQLVIPGG